MHADMLTDAAAAAPLSAIAAAATPCRCLLLMPADMCRRCCFHARRHVDAFHDVFAGCRARLRMPAAATMPLMMPAATPLAVVAMLPPRHDTLHAFSSCYVLTRATAAAKVRLRADATRISGYMPRHMLRRRLPP